jgi:chromosome segregation ATPase
MKAADYRAKRHLLAQSYAMQDALIVDYESAESRIVALEDALDTMNDEQRLEWARAEAAELALEYFIGKCKTAMEKAIASEARIYELEQELDVTAKIGRSYKADMQKAEARVAELEEDHAIVQSWNSDNLGAPSDGGLRDLLAQCRSRLKECGCLENSDLESKLNAALGQREQGKCLCTTDENGPHFNGCPIHGSTPKRWRWAAGCLAWYPRLSRPRRPFQMARG